jgi:hypothetical protein
MFFTGESIPIFVIGSICATIVLITYYRTRKTERMAMITAGLDPFADKKPMPDAGSMKSLKYGITLFFIGMGLVFGMIVSTNSGLSSEGVVLSSVLMFGGLGLLIFYYIKSKKEKNAKI